MSRALAAIRNVAHLLEVRTIAVLQAYSDESGIHDSAVAFSLAGYVAPETEWEKFAEKWSPVVQREGFKRFHTTDLLGGWGEFLDWPRDRAERLVDELVDAVISVGALGFSCSIIRGDPTERSGMARMVTEEPYLGAFGIQVRGLCNRADSFLGMEEKIGFIYDSHKEWGPKAQELYEASRLDENFPCRNRLGLIGFQPCDDEQFLPLHPADLLAWEIRFFLEERRRDPRVRPRPSLARLCAESRVQVATYSENELNPEFAKIAYEMALEGTPFKVADKPPRGKIR